MKSTDPNDRRNQQLYLTKKGKQSCEFLQKEELFAVKVTLENTDKKSHAALLDQLNLMSQNVGELYTAFKKRRPQLLFRTNKQRKHMKTILILMAMAVGTAVGQEDTAIFKIKFWDVEYS